MAQGQVAPVLRQVVARLAAAGVASPRADAEMLVAHVLGVTRSRLLTAPDLSHEQLADLAELVRRRVAREPLQHLTGTAPFRQLELAVGPGVFVPRPETELVVQWGLRWLAGAGAGAGVAASAPVVVDLCAGSGAIALAIAGELPGSRVYAVEREPAALEWLRRNAAGHPVIVVAGDATDATTLSTLDGQVDLVLCNPPYVPAGAAAALPPEVTEHDPAVAVYAGPDGLDVIRPLVARVAGLLGTGGAFAVEHDEGQGAAVPALLHATGCFTGGTGHPDLAGRARCTAAVRA
ncbi:MAG: peptide chain release factor N(5)-glutamine methyltransferase [Micromonosporaceae bacterium]